jgi:hypothetical protein
LFAAENTTGPFAGPDGVGGFDDDPLSPERPNRSHTSTTTTTIATNGA